MFNYSTKVSQYELPVKIEPQEEGGFVATCPVWQDCYAQGETIDETVLEITAVAQSLIELYREEEKKIPLKLQKQRDISDSLNIPVIVPA